MYRGCARGVGKVEQKVSASLLSVGEVATSGRWCARR